MPSKTQEKQVEAYTGRLLSIPDAARLFGLSKSSFLRFRKKHGVKTLPGKRVHIADIIAAMERERLDGPKESHVMARV